MGYRGSAEAGVKEIGPEPIPTEISAPGEALAFDLLYDQYGSYVYNACLGIVGSPDDARDAMQDTFVQLYRSLPRIRDRSVLRTWLYRVAANKCADILRKRPRWQTTDPGERPGGASQPSGEELLEYRVRQTILQLKPEFRVVLVLCYFERLSYCEMALALRCSVDQVRGRLHRARQAFRMAYRDGGDDIEV